MQKKSYLALFALAISPACVTIPNTETCSVAGTLSAGAICAETETGKTRDLNLDQFIEFLEPAPERPDPAHPGAILPARGGAICQSTEDWNAQKTALEQACRELGPRCSLQVKNALKTFGVKP